MFVLCCLEIQTTNNNSYKNKDHNSLNPLKFKILPKTRECAMKPSEMTSSSIYR